MAVSVLISWLICLREPEKRVVVVMDNAHIGTSERDNINIIHFIYNMRLFYHYIVHCSPYSNNIKWALVQIGMKHTEKYIDH